MDKKRSAKVTQKSRRQAPSRTVPVFANVILKSATGRPVRDAKLSPRNVKEFLPATSIIEQARRILREMGFGINIAAATHITISGPKELFEKTFSLSLIEQYAPYFEGQKEREQLYYEPDRPVKLPPSLSDFIEMIEFPGPIIYFVSATPPPLAYDHLEVPHDVARAMDALKAHRLGITGAGINMAMVDTGFMTPFHPYYLGKGYNIQPLVADPLDPAPNTDECGHGTGVASCALAVAPDVTFTVYKYYGINAVAAFARAAAARPHIITCSWGRRPLDPAAPPGAVPEVALQLAINNAVADGVVVCFASGNGADIGWPGSEPAVISVGGVFIDKDDSLQASNYATSGRNAINPDRQVPDLCGIVGMAGLVPQPTDPYPPGGIFIAMPTQPHSTEELEFYHFGEPYPAGDSTRPMDGWLVASGTSSACPMVAATVALMMQNDPFLVGDPDAVRRGLRASCVDITAGSSFTGQFASAGSDDATGAGLVQAYRAVRSVDIWIKHNKFDIGLVPTHNRRPKWPPFSHWMSPDIKVFAAPLGNPKLEFDAKKTVSPVFNKDNYVYVSIRNRGIGHSGQVTVSLYYADPGTNLIFPTDWHDGQSGIPASGSISVAERPTNNQTFPNVFAGGDEVLGQPFVWRPPNPTSATQTQILPDGRIIGHFCLLVRLSAVTWVDGEPIDEDPIIFSSGQACVVSDNNIGMKNEQIYTASPGRKFSFSFYVRAGVKEKGTAQSCLLFDLTNLPTNADAILELPTNLTTKAKLVNARKTKHGVLLSAGTERTGQAHVILKHRDRFLAKLSVNVPKSTLASDYPLEVLQCTEGGEVLGGITLIARVVM